jgi:polysaccharide chain length determinant protein (PEP-CTERM system associated)
MFYQRSLVYRILDSFFRHRLLFLVSTLTIVALIVCFLALKPKTYVGGYTVIEDDRILENPLSDSQTTNYNDVDESVNHLQSLISTQDFLTQALKNPDGTNIELDAPLDLDDPNVLAELRKDISVDESANDAFTLNMEYKNPDDIKRILSEIISTYITQTAQEKSAFYSEDVAFIQQQVDDYRSKLTSAESALTDFKAQNANNLPSEQEAIEQEMVTYQSQLQDLQIQQGEDQMRDQYLHSQISQIPPTIVATQTATDSPLVTQLKSLEVQLDTDIAVKQMKPTHPEVIALQEQIERLKASMAQKVKDHDSEMSGLTSTDTEPNPLYQSLQGQLFQVQIDEHATAAKKTETQLLLSKAVSGAALVPAAQRTLTNLERDYSTYSSSYDNLMSRLQEAQINEQLNLRQAASAYTVLQTSPPVSSQGLSKILMMFIGGVFLALVIGISLVMLSEFLDRSIRDPLDAQRILGMPILAVLPDSPILRLGEHPERFLNGQPDLANSKALPG